LSESFDYTLSGLTIRSSVALPELVPHRNQDGHVDVVITFCEVPESLANALYADFYYQATRDSLLINVPATGRYLIRQGREILVHQFDGVEDRNMRIFLLGAAFAAICHQRGLLPLHASAIAVNGECIAFAGDSGAGKSTLAAFLAQKGFTIICDDICVLATKNNEIWAHPGFPRLKLWQNSLQALGRDVQDLHRVHTQEDKYHLPIQAGFGSEPLRLRRIYILREADNAIQKSIGTIKGFEAVTQLADNTYQGRIVTHLDSKTQHFILCAKIAETAEICHLTRRMGFEYMEEVVADLIAHWHCDGNNNSIR